MTTPGGRESCFRLVALGDSITVGVGGSGASSVGRTEIGPSTDRSQGNRPSSTRGACAGAGLLRSVVLDLRAERAFTPGGTVTSLADSGLEPRRRIGRG